MNCHGIICSAAGLGETRSRLGLLGELGLSSIPTAYAGQNQLLANLQPRLESERIQSALRATGLGLGAQLAESGLEAQLGYEALANAIRQQQFQGLFDLLKGEQQPAQTNQITGAMGEAFSQAIEALKKQNAAKATGAFT